MTLQAALYMKMFDADAFIFVVVDKDSKDIMICDCSDEFIRTGTEKLEDGNRTVQVFLSR